jgi:hypothetical protein
MNSSDATNQYAGKFSNEIKQGREHREFIENPEQCQYGVGIMTIKP